MTFSKTLAICLFSVLILSVSSHTQDESPSCAHHLFEVAPELLEVEEETIVDDGRNLATQTYPNLRMKADFTRMSLGTTAFKNYVKNDLLPPILDYFQAALAVKKPLTTPLKISSSSICGLSTPTLLKNGVATDFFVVVSSSQDSSNWVASAGACYLASSTKRPLIARMLFNIDYTKDASNDVLLHERNMYLTMHEMLHALGFAMSSFKNFINASGQTLTGHIKTVTLNGSNRTVLDVEPLTSKLRSHFGCSTLQGAFMEDDGGAGTAGSHFERRHFLYETMTSGVIYGRRISEFSLAVLEGSGWYMPNYTYAEPFFFGQGQGCNFLYQECTASTFDFDEFCTGSSRRCTAAGGSGGICSSDSRSEGCRYSIPVVDYDCQNPDAADNARVPERESYGRDAGSRCFDGTLTKTKTSSPTSASFCFKYNCVGSGLDTKLEIMFGSTKITCTRESTVTISTFSGNLKCPDPLTYCSTVGKKYCPRNCLGRGDCVDNVCKCKAGYTGIDCALNA